MKLIVLKIEQISTMWSEKIFKSIEEPLWWILVVKGGYTGHPVPTTIDKISHK